MMERLFPSSENTGCTPSSADVPDICDCCLEPKHDTLRLCLPYCWLKTLELSTVRDFLFFLKEQKYFYFTLAAREVTQTPVVSFTVFFSSLFTNKMFVSVGINWKQIQWRQDWLEVVSGSIEQNYNYLLLHLVMWPPVPGVNLLLSPVSAQPNTAKLLKWGQRSGLGKA